MYSIRKTGQPNTLGYRAYLEKDELPISSWHDIPLWADKEELILNMVVEIPRWSNAKFEISRNEPFNPIKQDVKKGALRFVHNRFPYKGYIWNYGALPRTWEDPSIVLSETQTRGDNDPLDACEIGEAVGYTGQIKQVKVLGVMCLLDDNETDWKIIVIDVNDPLASQLKDIGDVGKHFPGLLGATTEWFQYYKVPDGKQKNEVAFSGQFKNREYALAVVHECSEAWDRLINGKSQPGEISLTSVTNVGFDIHQQETFKIPPAQDLSPAPMEQNIDKWYFTPAEVIRKRYPQL